MPVNGIQVFLPLGVPRECPDPKQYCRQAAARDDIDGLEMKGPRNLMAMDFCPQWLGNKLYSIHMENTALSEFYADELSGETNNWFSKTLDWIYRFRTLPVAIVFHGPRYPSPSVLLNENRYTNHLSENQIQDMKSWLSGLFSRMKDMSLPVMLENLPSMEFAGPPHYGKVWAPITYLAPWIGASPSNILDLRCDYGIDICLDIEHAKFSQNYDHRAGEYSLLPWDQRDKVEYSLYDLIKSLHPTFIHLSGSDQEIVRRCECEPGVPEAYLATLVDSGCYTAEQLEFCRRYRVNSHAIIPDHDPTFSQLVKTLVANGAETLVVETATTTPADCWYWLPDDSRERSLQNLISYL